MAETIPSRIEALAQLEQHMVEGTMSALDQITAVVSGLDGRRVLVYVSDGLPMQPAAEVYQYFKPEEFMRDDNLVTGFDGVNADPDRRWRQTSASWRFGATTCRARNGI
jgi:hypothetical protein